jgi:hypothetical protein
MSTLSIPFLKTTYNSSAMSPMQKRTWGRLLQAFGVILLPVAVGVMIFRWKTAPPPAILALLVAGALPIWFGTILISQAKKEDGK